MKALVALGSNLGDRAATLRSAVAALRRLPSTRLLDASRLLATAPEAAGDGGWFLNGAALLETGLGPRALLDALLAVEARHGRRPRHGVRGPRTLDLDLILYGSLRQTLPGLVLPHPRFRSRSFVLAPAAEIAPRLVDPKTGYDVASLLRALS